MAREADERSRYGAATRAKALANEANEQLCRLKMATWKKALSNKANKQLHHKTAVQDKTKALAKEVAKSWQIALWSQQRGLSPMSIIAGRKQNAARCWRKQRWLRSNIALCLQSKL